MENSSNNNQNNPSGIWQGRWAKQLDLILECFYNFDYLNAWNALEDFKTILPPDCETDIEKVFQETKKAVFTTRQYSYIPEINVKQKQKTIYTTIIPKERELLTAIKKSLFDRGWINKNFSVKPRYENLPMMETE